MLVQVLPTVLLLFGTCCRFGVRPSDALTDPAPSPTPRAGHGLAEGMSWFGRLYVVGGCTRVENATSTWALLLNCSAVNDEVWSMLWEEHSGDITWGKLWPPAPAPNDAGAGDVSQAKRNGASVVSFSLPGSGSGVTTLFIWAGADHNGLAQPDAWYYETERGIWTNLTIGAGVKGRAFHSTLLYKNWTIMFGGASASASGEVSVFSDVVVFDLMSRSWTVAQPDISPPSRAFHSSSLLSGFPQTMFVYGGVGSDGKVLSDLWLAHWVGEDVAKTLTWKEIQPVGETPPPLFGHSLLEYVNNTDLTVSWGFTEAGLEAWDDGWTVRLGESPVRWHRERWPTALRARGCFGRAGVGYLVWVFGGAGALGVNGSRLLNDVFTVGPMP